MSKTTCLIILGVAPIVAVGLACSRPFPETTDSTKSAIVVGSNVNVTNSVYQMHETSVAGVIYTPDNGPPVPHWVVGFNNCAAPYHVCSNDRISAYAYSSDIDGSSWTVHIPSSGTEFGLPPERNCSDGAKFAGLHGDPTLAAATDPAANDSGRRVYYVSLANSIDNLNADIAVMVSTDGGVNFRDPHFVSTAYNASPPSQNTGEQSDYPKLAVDSVAPFGAWVSWSQELGPEWINRFEYDSSLNFSIGTPVQIPTSSSSVYYQDIAVGPLDSCSGMHEAVYVAWADTDGPRCDGKVQEGGMGWWYAVYDTDAHEWWGPWPIVHDEAWPNCIADVDAGRVSTNVQGPSVAFDHVTRTLFVAHTASSKLGTRARLFKQRFSCKDGAVVPADGGGVAYLPPDPCYRTSSPCVPGESNGPNGEPIQNDEWGVTLGFQRTPLGSGTIPRLLMTWYDTRGDLANRLVRVWGVMSEDDGDSFSGVFPISIASSGQTVPWDYRSGTWDDYNGIASDPSGTSFFHSWGGDARLGAAAPGIWGVRLQ